MAFVKASAAAPHPPAPPPESTDRLLELLTEGDVAERRHAARALSRDPDAALVLAARLEHESDKGVRDALFGSLGKIGGMQTAGLVAGLLRSEDAGLRGGAVETLKQMRDDAVPVLDTLLSDSDPDTRILVVEVIRAWPGPTAVPRLLRVIETDPHVNVCGAAVDVITEAGTKDLLPALAALRARFAGDQFLVFAVDVACSRINAAAETGA
jgi:HEAT repeat protein